MSLTPQQVRGIPTQQAGNKLMQAGNWSKTFPTKIETESKSCTYVKKLLTVAFSNITYLRSMFPEEAYANRDLDGLSLKILREKNSCEEAKILAGWLIGTFEALEKKYLRELIFSVYLDSSNPDEVHEMYTFKFNYPGGQVSCQMLQGQEKGDLEASPNANNIYKSTQSLLRTLVVLTQGLDPLPESAYLSMKLTYYDEVTPEDYEPQGFKPTLLVTPVISEGISNVKVGEVSTGHHSVKIRVQAALRQVAESVGEHPSVVTNSFSCTESDSGVDHRGDVSFGNKREAPTEEQSDRDTYSASQQEIYFQAPVSRIACICKNLQPDLLMMTCHFCGLRQHAACYRILHDENIPAEHCCVSCSIKESVPCTDRKLVKMSNNPAVFLTCIYRRALAALTRTDVVSQDFLCTNIGVSVAVAAQILNKLHTDKCILSSGDGLFSVDKKTVESVALPRYMGVKKHEVSEHLGSIVENSEKINIKTVEQILTPKKRSNDLDMNSVGGGKRKKVKGSRTKENIGVN